MKKLSSSEIRALFLDYFKRQTHTVVPTSPLVPGNDPTLLFTNAGMVQFKDVFLGLEKRPYTRSATAQRCVRAGGKHNDLENVGYTARHHTFFEMLGNFSFGDYFKREAIYFAWEFLTTELKLPREKLWITVYEEDDEAAAIWLNEIKVDPQRFSRIGAKDNFWSMGDTGPCGPCSEIFFDHGAAIPGGPPGSPDADGDRYIEIWNLVFMQYNRSADGKLEPLPKPSVDTGMGLERLAAVLQGVHSNYDIDSFQHLIGAAAKLTGQRDLNQASLRVIADHIRACAFLITDGVVPSNEGRGYVLRRIIRRAIRHGYELGQKQPFFHQLVGALCDVMGAAYPELPKARAQVERVLKQEEERFAETLEQGMRILEDAIKKMRGDTVPGDVAFKLYDTYGFPVDLTADIARARNLKVDMQAFEREMNQQRERARAASHFDVAYASKLDVAGRCEFTGYEHLTEQAKILGIFVDGKPVDALKEGSKGAVVLDRTPFYAESGGQVGDQGLITINGNEFCVRDTQKQGEIILHNGVMVRGNIKSNAKVEANVDGKRRRDIAYNHSATHLLHAALRRTLGDHVTQKGSLVNPERLRFDFAHFEALSAEQLAGIEGMVNAHIRNNHAVETKISSLEDAMKSGAMALFGEKYGDDVRVLRMGDFSTELCGGTHITRTGDIGLFKIVSEGGVAAGVRRIEAVTGQRALEWIQAEESRMARIAESVKGGRDNVEERVTQLLERARGLEKELEKLKGKLASSQGGDLAGSAIDVGGIKVIAARMEGADAKALRDTVDQLKNKLGQAAIVLAAVDGGNVSLVAGVTKEASAKVKAGELVNMVAQQIGGKGGGRPDMAQAGGNNPAALDGALKSVAAWVGERLG
ncbi:MAG: alanine--tRNA ligase [Gammaproteobacteria bacterium]|nr:alanine--tRNA ligase [Gammaproteobacteria bacterium]